MTRMIAQLLVGLLMFAVPVMAHEGHAHKTMGVVTMVHDNHVEVKDLKDKTTTFTLDEKTKITRGRTALRAADIKVGERVVVTYQQVKDRAGKITVVVKAVQLGATPVTSKTAGR